jgi:hypothetical protein
VKIDLNVPTVNLEKDRSRKKIRDKKKKKKRGL